MVLETTVPAGYTIRYESTPRKRVYAIDGVEVPSVTTVLGCLDKPALPWWGMTVGANGVAQLLRENDERRQNDGPIEEWGRVHMEVLADPVQALKDAKLTVNHQLRKAGDRGTGVHDATEILFEGRWPDLSKIPADAHGYVSAACDFWIDAFGYGVSPLGFKEVMVGVKPRSVIVEPKHYGYAGRYDLEATLMAPVSLVSDAERGTRQTFEGSGLWDYKTSKGVYLSHMIQLEAYELARVECGYEPTDFRAVVHLLPDGTYEVVKSHAGADTFLSILSTYNALKQDEGRKPKKPRRTTRKEAA